MHHPTADESTLAWWCLLLSLDKHVPFKGIKRPGGSGESYKPEPEQYLKELAANYTPKGQVLHQNTCGHGYVPTVKFHLLDHTRHASPSPSSMEGGYANSTLLGASPSEIQFRGYEDRRKRWSKT